MMRRFKCPKCGHVVQARALAVAHRCPAAQSKTVQYVLEEQP